MDSDLKLKRLLATSSLKDFNVNEAIKTYLDYKSTCTSKDLLKKLKKTLQEKKNENITELVSKKQIKDIQGVERIVQEMMEIGMEITGETGKAIVNSFTQQKEKDEVKEIIKKILRDFLEEEDGKIKIKKTVKTTSKKKVKIQGTTTLLYDDE